MPVEYRGQSSGFVINACVSQLRSQWQWRFRGVQFTAQWSGKCAQWTVHSGQGAQWTFECTQWTMYTVAAEWIGNVYCGVQ